MELALSLDAGTTALKGTLFDREGRLVAQAQEEYSLLTPGPDLAELGAEAYWRAACRVARALAAPGRRIASVGVTSQGETLIALDAQGRPLRRAIVWLDNRSRDEADAIGAQFGLDEIYRRTGQQEMAPTWTATRLLWMRRHEPETFAKARRFLMVEDYLIYRLTGRFATDRALNPSTLYYDILSGEWWPEMLDFLGVGPGQLPELKTSGECAGRVSGEAARQTGLEAGAPVSTAPIDQIAAAVGAGNLEAGMVTESTGAALALCAAVDRPVYDPQKRLGLYAHALPGRYVLMPWAHTAGMVLRWFRDAFGGGLDYAALADEAASVPPGADGLLAFPHMAGMVCPVADPRAKGVFFGVGLGHGRPHFVRAIMEGVACMVREQLEMLLDLGARADALTCIGGAARSDLWLQIKADMCQRELAVPECEEAAGLGTAMISWVSAGAYPTLQEAKAAMIRPRQRVQPDGAKAGAYDAVYGRYLELYRRLKGLF